MQETLNAAGHRGGFGITQGNHFGHVDELFDIAVGRDIGFEYARFGLKLSDDVPLAVREGYTEGEHAHKRSTDRSGKYGRKLLRLRFSAYKRGRSIDPAITPGFIEQIDVAYCPITRIELTSGTGTETDGTVDRVFNGGGYAIGNIAVMSMLANQAKGALMPLEILKIASLGEDRDGLNYEGWMRLAGLTSLAAPPGYPVSHLPLFVYPPNGILLTNAFTLFQKSISDIAAGFVAKRWSVQFRNVFDGKEAKKRFDSFVEALNVQISLRMRGVSNPELQRFAICDSWVADLVYERYQTLIGSVSKPELLKLTGIATQAQQSMRHYQAKELDSWMMSTRGYVS